MINFDDLMQCGFWAIPKIIFANLCKPIPDIIIIQVSSDPLKLETVEKEKIQETEYLENKKSFLIEIENYFVQFLKNKGHKL